MAENSSDDRRDDGEETRREGRGVSKPPKAMEEDADGSAKQEGEKPKAEAQDDGSEAEAAKGSEKAEVSKADVEDALASEMARPKPSPKKEPKPAPKAAAKAPDPGLLTPTNVALLLAAAGLGAFWKGWSLFRSEGKDFYSGSAWLFLIAFFLVTVSAFHFLGAQLQKKPGEKGKSLLEAIVPALPFFALYAVVWWSAWDAWSVLYGPNGRSWMWMFFIALALASWGVWYALRPPSAEEVKADRLPTRRVILLLMLPFVTVYGMIWMAERAITRH